MEQVMNGGGEATTLGTPDWRSQARQGGWPGMHDDTQRWPLGKTLLFAGSCSAALWLGIIGAIWAIF